MLIVVKKKVLKKVHHASHHTENEVNKFLIRNLKKNWIETYPKLNLKTYPSKSIQRS